MTKKLETLLAPAFEYREHTITLDTGRGWKFRIEGPSAIAKENPIWVDTFDQAKDRIDRMMQAERKQKSVKLSLPCLDSNGKKLAATGVHAGNGYVLGGGDGDYLYPDLPWVQETITKLLRLREEASDLDRLLYPIRMKVRRTYGRVDPAQYEGIVAQFVAEHERYTKSAQEKAPKA